MAVCPYIFNIMIVKHIPVLKVFFAERQSNYGNKSYIMLKTTELNRFAAKVIRKDLLTVISVHITVISDLQLTG